MSAGSSVAAFKQPFTTHFNVIN